MMANTGHAVTLLKHSVVINRNGKCWNNWCLESWCVGESATQVLCTPVPRPSWVQDVSQLRLRRAMPDLSASSPWLGKTWSRTIPSSQQEFLSLWNLLDLFASTVNCISNVLTVLIPSALNYWSFKTKSWRRAGNLGQRLVQRCSHEKRWFLE